MASSRWQPAAMQPWRPPFPPWACGWKNPAYSTAGCHATPWVTPALTAPTAGLTPLLQGSFLPSLTASAASLAARGFSAQAQGALAQGFTLPAALSATAALIYSATSGGATGGYASYTALSGMSLVLGGGASGIFLPATCTRTWTRCPTSRCQCTQPMAQLALRLPRATA